jgi:hypothetical protein
MRVLNFEVDVCAIVLWGIAALDGNHVEVKVKEL